MPEHGTFTERTALAWQRSALALAVVAALFLHAGRVLGTVTGAIVLAAAAVAYVEAGHTSGKVVITVA